MKINFQEFNLDIKYIIIPENRTKFMVENS